MTDATFSQQMVAAAIRNVNLSTGAGVGMVHLPRFSRVQQGSFLAYCGNAL